MKTTLKLITGCLSILFLALTAEAQTSGYKVVDNIKVGGEGGWDYLTCDTTMHRVYISRGSHVQVFDMENKTIVGDIPNTIGVHGIALVPEFGRGYTSNGRDSSVTVFDLQTFQTLRVIKIQASNPDAICYDRYSHRIFTFNGRSSSATAIDAQTDSVVGYIQLDGKPEFAVSDGNGKIFANLEDKSMIVALDTKALKTLERWPLSPGEEPSGLAIDREHHLLFSGCGNKMMVVLDATSGKVVSTLPIGEGVDATAYDPGTHLAFSSNGDGTLTVIQEESVDKFSVLENVATQKRSKTMALDEKTHRVYLGAAAFGPTPAPTPEQPRPRPVMEPGSFSILILER